MNASTKGFVVGVVVGVVAYHLLNSKKSAPKP
jgi:uncharacterized membrane-anchored protein YhcB (DUF1043 family)